MDEQNYIFYTSQPHIHIRYVCPDYLFCLFVRKVFRVEMVNI